MKGSPVGRTQVGAVQEEVREMLGHAITTELHLLAAKDRMAELAAAYRTSRVPDSERDSAVDPGSHQAGSSAASAAVAIASGEMP